MTAEPERDERDGGHEGDTLPAAQVEALRAAAPQILEAAWREVPGGGFCVPHAVTYPWQWLWDSCFHAVVWAHLGDPRAERELRSALSDQSADGFVPHLRYADGVSPHAALWGRRATSSITQPPMYGHAVAELARRGMAPGADVVDRAGRGLRFLLERRRRSPGGLIELCHPWESGCDDSPRWDDVLDEPWTSQRWFAAKGDLLAGIERSPEGSPLRNPAFPVASVGFSALVAFNALELASFTADERLAGGAQELVAAIDARWDPQLATWVDDGPTATRSGSVRTLDALLPLLVSPRRAAFDELVDPAALGAPCGPRGVHAAEPAYDPRRYWRGPAWPQLTYLLWVACTRGGAPAVASSLVRSIVAGTAASGFAEYWDPDDGTALGAVPQSWTTLSWVMADS